MSVKLTDTQLEKILPVLRTFPELRLGLPRQSRRFLARRPLDDPFGFTMAVVAKRIRQLEYGLQTLCPVEQTRRF